MKRAAVATARIAWRLLRRTATVVSTMLIALDGRRLPPPPRDAEPEEYRA